MDLTLTRWVARGSAALAVMVCGWVKAFTEATRAKLRQTSIDQAPNFA